MLCKEGMGLVIIMARLKGHEGKTAVMIMGGHVMQ